MEEESRVIRAVSGGMQRPYFQIKYKLSLTGRELFNDAMHIPNERVTKTLRSYSSWYPESEDLAAARENRAQSLADTSNMREYLSFESQLPGTPGTSPSHSNLSDRQRSRSAYQSRDMEVNRKSPPLSISQLKQSGALNRADMAPFELQDFPGLVTCLNSRNTNKYVVGQKYKNGIIVGIDENLNKIILFRSDMPCGSLIVVKTHDATSYERGYQVQSFSGVVIGIVHATDAVRNFLIVDTSLR